jgi:SulP family sulfate permease
LRKTPRADAVGMVVAVLIVVITDDLSKGVFAGVILSAIFITVKISKINLEKKVLLGSSQNFYSIKGHLFFDSVEDYTKEFDNVQEGSRLVIDFTGARIWDDSGAGAVNRLITKLKQKDVDFVIIGIDASSSRLLDSLSVPYVK